MRCAQCVKSKEDVAYCCYYHVVWCPKYRRPVLDRDISKRLKAILKETALECGAEITELEVMPDRVHLVVSIDPQYGVHRLVKTMKAASSRILRSEFPQINRKLPTLWTNSYFVATVGGAQLEVLERYVEDQKGR